MCITDRYAWSPPGIGTHAAWPAQPPPALIAPNGAQRSAITAPSVTSRRRAASLLVAGHLLDALDQAGAGSRGLLHRLIRRGATSHAVFLGLREDKTARDVVQQVADPDEERHLVSPVRAGRFGGKRSPVIAVPPKRSAGRNSTPRQPASPRTAAARLRACSTFVESICPVEQALSPWFDRQLCRRAGALICRRCLTASAIVTTAP